MLIDSMIIKLIHGGVGIGPEYSLTIYGDGRVIYKGEENVKEKGIIESSIDDEKVILLLTEFKKIDFFTLSDSYSPSDPIDRPYTFISISIPKENGETARKSIKFYLGDRNVPQELKTLEAEIYEIVGANKWIGEASEAEGFKPIKEAEIISKIGSDTTKGQPLHHVKKKTIKIFAISLILIIIIFLLIYGFYSGILSFPTKDKDSEENIELGDNPEITVLITASDVRGIGDYDEESTFDIGSMIWIYQEYTDISILPKALDEDACDITLNITITTIVDNESITYHSDEDNKNTTGNFGHAWWLITDDTWPTGIYSIETTLIDNISNKASSRSTDFNLV